MTVVVTVLVTDSAGVTVVTVLMSSDDRAGDRAGDSRDSDSGTQFRGGDSENRYCDPTKNVGYFTCL